MKYSDKLKDPRWQKKRLEILERDEWSCQICHDTESTLHVHHRRYFTDKDPWDYPDGILITLCEDCHEHEKDARSEYENMLLSGLREKFFADDIYGLVLGVLNLKPFHASEVMASIFEFVFSDPEAQEMVSNLFWQKQREDLNAKQNIKGNDLDISKS